MPAPERVRGRWPLVRLVLALALASGFVAAFLAPAFLVLGHGARVAANVYRDTKVPPTPRLARTSYVYDRNGNLLMTLHGGINRTPVGFRDMPRSLRRAVIAAEDADFYSEGGVNPRAILRAAIANIRAHGVVQGGSTITQQYVKDLFTNGRRTVARKVREAIIAQKLSRTMPKNEILRKYLNEVYFGHGAYGVQAAAHTYFGIDAADLNIQQSATLAGIIAAPTRFDPILHPDDARDRRNYVLRRMAELHFLPQRQADTLAARPVETSHDEAPNVPGQYFLSYVRKALESHYGTKRTFEGGLHVTTTLDVHLQRLARRAVNTHLPTKGDPSAALVAIDPATGQVLAMVGGQDQRTTKFNLATQARRQAGSSFKPFTLATALAQGISLQSTWHGPPALLITDPRCQTPDPVTNLPGPWNVSNFEDESAGTMTLAEATANSVNTIFSQVVLDVGPENVARMAHSLGVRSPLRPVCSITLGTQPVTPLDMAAGYSTLAANGVRHEPTGILQVEDSHGRELDAPGGTSKEVLTPDVAALVTSALQGVIDHGTGTAANIGRPAAGKTGTAQNYQDAWFCGYTPQLVTCVWLGFPQGEIPMHDIEGFPNVFGGSIPALIWHDFMSSALADEPVEEFPVVVDPAVGDLIPPGSVGGQPLDTVEPASPDQNPSSITSP
jgi:penicillin-binding protein 1A